MRTDLTYSRRSLLRGMLEPATRQTGSANDIQLLQSAAALENSAVAAYDRVLRHADLAEVEYYATFLHTLRSHHADHAKAFNDAAARLGGKTQLDPHNGLDYQISAADPDSKDEPELANELLGFLVESSLAHTHAAATAELADADARSLMARTGAVESQHLAMMNVFESFFEKNEFDLVRVPTDSGAVREAAGDAALGERFQQTSLAFAASTGAVRD